MKHTLLKVLAVTAAGLISGLVNQAQADTVTWTFLENGADMNLGTSSSFTSSGYTVWAYGFTSGGVGSDLYSKSDGPGETGLGMVTDVGNDHEIDKWHFVQLDSQILPSGSVKSVELGSVQTHEDAAIYGSDTLGSLGTLIGTIAADGTFNLSGFAYRYIGITTTGSATAANVVVGALTAQVPDSGTTALLLGLGVLGLGLARRSKSIKA